MGNEPPEWPNDADGDVFRSLHHQGFDFSRSYLIDFNIDLPDIRTRNEAVNALRQCYPGASIKDYTDDNPPNVQLQILSDVDYNFVVQTQAKLSAEMKKYGGWCDSWGVLH
jgi:hypothetical protein